MRKSVFSVALLIAIGLMVWAPGEAQAQATGSIAGVVTDETGAVIPGRHRHDHERGHEPEPDDGDRH